jgi:hypothetical protein
MLRSVVSSMAAVLVTASLCVLVYGDAAAQTQTQGQTLNAPPPAGSPPAAPKPASPKAKRAECVSQGKDQGLKGRALTKFVKECLNKAA